MCQLRSLCKEVSEKDHHCIKIESEKAVSVIQIWPFFAPFFITGIHYYNYFSGVAYHEIFKVEGEGCH